MHPNSGHWDVSTNINATAIMVAACRAYASEDPRPLIVDPYAGFLVEAADFKGFNFRDRSSWSPEITSLLEWTKLHTIVRTKIIDDAIITAVDRGVRQLVILASGLDTRPYRLAALRNITTFEIDQKSALEFKKSVLLNHNVNIRENCKAVSVDSGQWITQLIDAGFNSRIPTIWITEAFLPQLPLENQWKIAQTIDQHSSPGSRWILDAYGEEEIEKFSAKKPENNDISSPENNTKHMSSADFVSTWTVYKETLGANRAKYNLPLPPPPSALQLAHPGMDPLSLVQIIDDSGFYIADK